MIKKGKLDARVLEAIEKYQFSKEFGWTPEYIDNMSLHEKNKYKAVMEGLAEAKSDTNGLHNKD